MMIITFCYHIILSAITQLYLECRLVWCGSRLLRPFLQVVAVWLALGVSFTRISDYKHHWSDVLAGGLMGTAVAMLTVSSLRNACLHLLQSTHTLIVASSDC